ncbi:hypothetical protein [Sporosalibacterium faouarense]|uniref:hypothetical protein n=1 Tax=Sporosalibacterium faouarense TaxID=516123 RepID=UPI00192AB952|nr:hypothetical protein [Sporosalibacterium faouarense]
MINNTYYRISYGIGLVVGALVVGVLCGLIPLILGVRRKQKGLAITAFILCIIGGMIKGFIAAVIIAIIFTIIIFIRNNNYNQEKL